MRYTKYYLAKCKRQKQIVEFLNKFPGASESFILLNVYGIDRRRGDNNKKGADALRRALHNGFVARKMIRGKFRYFSVDLSLNEEVPTTFKTIIIK
jgi:hypothetical protein